MESQLSIRGLDIVDQLCMRDLSVQGASSPLSMWEYRE